MKFRRDKVPSEPGFYWAKDSDGVTVGEVYSDPIGKKLVVSVLGWDSDIELDWILEWGDRIENPVDEVKDGCCCESMIGKQLEAQVICPDCGVALIVKGKIVCVEAVKED